MFSSAIQNSGSEETVVTYVTAHKVRSGVLFIGVHDTRERPCMSVDFI